jgi:pimeloyl-ACP methyl ester carboxylesterase
MKTLRVAGCISLLLFLVFMARSQTPGQSNPPPLGTLVDVGGYRVHLYCIGQGTPTVVIVGGAFSFDWQLVQPEVAKFTRVCTFDPSGTAWSDPFKITPARSTPACADRLDEIHRLITKAPIDGPYVLVGFSVGGLWERIYAAEYPDNILGMVIVDHAFQGGAPPHPASSSGSLRGYSPPALISQAPIEIGFEDNENFGKLPQRDRELHTWALAQHPILVDYQMVADCFSTIERTTAGREYPLGKMHLVVISTPNEARGYAELQARLLTLSHNSEHVIAWKSTHMVPIDEPEVITEAIHEVVDGAGKPSAQ